MRPIPAQSRGRLRPEPPSPTRNDFRRDCDRIIHSTAFRRLAHKTQVFVFHEGDHFRTRLTHTLEVTQIARSLARALGLDEDLAEALALAHDLGHPPFGHAGERALDRCLGRCGGFDHNAQTLRVVTALERRYAAFDGLNLTWETLEGLVKHNGPLTDRDGRRDRALSRARRAARDRASISATHGPRAVELRQRGGAGRGHSPTTSPMTPTISTTACAPSCSRSTISPRCRSSATSSPRSAGRRADLDPGRIAHELVRRLITHMIEDVIAETGRRLRRARAAVGRGCARRAGPVGSFSPAMARGRSRHQGLPLSAHVPAPAHHAHHGRCRDAWSAICSPAMPSSPQDLPADWAQGDAAEDEGARLRRIADFIAGMTDRYALIEHARLFPSTPELR